MRENESAKFPSNCARHTYALDTGRTLMYTVGPEQCEGAHRSHAREKARPRLTGKKHLPPSKAWRRERFWRHLPRHTVSAIRCSAEFFFRPALHTVQPMRASFRASLQFHYRPSRPRQNEIDDALAQLNQLCCWYGQILTKNATLTKYERLLP